MQDITFIFNPEKDNKVRRERGIGFKEIIALLETGHLLFTSDHPNQEKYPGQQIYEIEVNNYVYMVPFIQKGNEVFLRPYMRTAKPQKNTGKETKMAKKHKKATKPVKMHPLDDDPEEERMIMEARKNGVLRLSSNQERHRRIAMQAARNYLRKDARINIRLSGADLQTIKYRAATEGLPYQTLVASILHKFATGQL